MDLGGGVLLRPLLAGDGPELAAAYTRNREHLAPWEPLRPAEFFTVRYQAALVTQSLHAADEGRGAPYALTADERIVGRVNLSDIVRGAFQNGNLGYWIDRDFAGRGIMRRAVATVCTLALDQLGLHRVQAATLVHNTASQAVLRANGFHHVGLAERYLRIAGEWQDHLIFQRILEDDVTPAPGSP